MVRHGGRGLACFVIALLLGAALPAPPARAQAQTRLIPALAVTERYDSNVFFSPGISDPSDFVTTVAPQVRMEHKSRLLAANAQLTLTGEIYAKNPGLNYIAPTAGMDADLSQFIGQFNKRIKLLVNDFVTYTPQPPAFFTPSPGGATPAEPGLNFGVEQNYIRGIQAVRANSLINIGSITGIYEMTPSTNLVSTYSNTFMRFGTGFAGVPGQGFFQTTFHSLNLGPKFKVSPRDLLSITGNYSYATFSQGNVPSTSFEIKGVTAGWNRALTPKLTVDATGGLTVFTGSNDLQYLASLSVTYHERNTDVIAGYSRSIFPSFFIAAVPLLSQNITLSVVHRFNIRWSASASVNYAKNESVPDPFIVFDSYGGSASLNYQITQTLSAAANYTYNKFESLFLTQDFSFNRNMISLTLRKEWR